MRAFILLMASTVALVGAREGFALTDEQKMTIDLGLCPVFDYMACLRKRIKADKALKKCSSNSECDMDSGSYCCPSKCAGMRCAPEGSRHFVHEYCPKYHPVQLLRKCKKMDGNCTSDCRCCADITTCSYECLDWSNNFRQ